MHVGSGEEDREGGEKETERKEEEKGRKGRRRGVKREASMNFSKFKDNCVASLSMSTSFPLASR
jgi:hypothetical protein